MPPKRQLESQGTSLFVEVVVEVVVVIVVEMSPLVFFPSLRGFSSRSVLRTLAPAAVTPSAKRRTARSMALRKGILESIMVEDEKGKDHKNVGGRSEGQF